MVIKTFGDTYLHAAYATDAMGSNFSLTYFDGALYLGNYSDESATESTNPAAYKWQVLGDSDLNSDVTDVDSIEANDTEIDYLGNVDTDIQADIIENKENAQGAAVIASDAMNIASDTAQYFWFTSEGTDTGAHITEVPREEFLSDPANGGGNLLARSNGIAVREGLNEMAVFGTNGMQVGQTLVTPQVVIGQANISMRTDEGATFFSIDGTNSSAQSEAVVASQYDFSWGEEQKSITLVGTIPTGADINVSGLWFKWGGDAAITSLAVASTTNGTATATATDTILNADDMTFTFGTAETKTATVTVDYTTESETGTFVLTITVAYDGARAMDFTMTYAHTVGSELLIFLGMGGHYNDITALVSDVKAPAFTLGTRAGNFGALSLTAGTSLYAENNNEVALGQYNTNGNYALVVGNGTNDTNRSDAFAIGWDGEIYINGEQMTDYVVETGTANGWKYTLWNSGLVEATRALSGTQTAYQTMANAFGAYRFASVATPFAMDGDYYVSGDWSIGNGFGIPAGTLLKTATSFNVYGMSNIRTGTVAVSCTLYLRGYKA